eukprot:PhF_6_TR25874/c1_g1_i1/m.36580
MSLPPPDVGVLQVQLFETTRQLEDSRGHLRILQQEVSQLRLALYEQDGTRTAIQLRELELENKRLRMNQARDQEALLLSQQERLKIQNELVDLKSRLQHSPSIQEQLESFRMENQRLTTQINELLRLNVESSAQLRQQESLEDFKATLFEKDNMTEMHGGITPYVRIRKAVLCPVCRSNVDVWEGRLRRRVLERDPRLELGAHHLTASPLPHMAFHGWRELRMQDGKSVYHNEITGQSTFLRPPSMDRAAAT